jgi:hypothetical protein
MGETLGIGMTHYPGPMWGKPQGNTWTQQIRKVLTSRQVPEHMKDPKNWPSAMQDEWEHELERAVVHWEEHRAGFQKVRQAIDDFNPDAVIIFGDDQYENFKEDLIPPFNVYCADEFPCQPFYRHTKDNLWGVEPETVFNVPGAGMLGREIANGLIERDFPIPYSYKSLHFTKGLGHAFANGLVYLDFDHDNPWNYPVIPIQVNCYGKAVLPNRGGMAHLYDDRSESEKDPYLDTHGPEGPTPRSCFRLGQLLREILDERPERTVVIASSSWSHAFLTGKNHYLWPDREADQQHVDQLRAGQQRRWADLTNQEIFDSGDQEFRNWICMAGVVEERTPSYVSYLDTWIFNSPKCFAILPPN